MLGAMLPAVLASLLLGCARMEFAPGRTLLIHEELPAADRAVEAARQAGKDRECPDAFNEVVKLRDEAYAIYWSCRTQEAIAKANEVVSRAQALCPRAAAPLAPAPTVSVAASPATIVQGQCTTLTWSSANATSAALDPGYGAVDPSGARQVCPAATTEYTVAAQGPGGSGRASATVTVSAAAPTATLSANPAAIVQGQCTTLTWSAANATSAAIDPGVGEVNASGSRQVCPTATTQYTLAAQGPGGSGRASTTVAVSAPVPTATLSANPVAIAQGQCTTLTWSSANATSAAIEPGIGSVAPSGSRQVCPPATTQYTLAAQGPGGSGRASTTVAVSRVVDRLTLHINFDFDKADIRREGVAELQKAVEFVKKYPGYKITLAGHTDGVGTDAYNQPLSERRAAAVKDYLLKQGVANGQRIQSQGFGKTKPIASNETPEGRFQNRRVEILILSE
jgi:outer membrane protein OmpA-like peptidoglycan-associated protein